MRSAISPRRRSVTGSSRASGAGGGEIVDQFFQPNLHLGVQPRGPGTLVAQRGGGHSPAPVQRAQQGVGRHPDVVKEHLGEIGVAVERDERTDLDAGQFHVDDQAGDPFVFRGVRVGAHVELAPVGTVPERRPDLLAVDDEVVTVTHRPGAQRGEIGSRFGLRHPLAPDVVGAHHAGEQRFLLVFGAVLHDRGGDVVQPNDVERHRSPSARGFLGIDKLLENRRSAAAVFAGPGDGGPSRVGHRRAPGAQHLERRVVAAGGPAGGDQLIGQVRGQPVAQLGAELFHFRWIGEVHFSLALVPGGLAGLYG